MCGIYNTHTQSQASKIVYDFGHGNVVEGDSVNVCLNAGTYYMTITATGTNGCTGIYNYTNSPITVYPKPGGDFNWTPETPNTSNNQVTFVPSTKNGKTFTYQWEFTNSTNVGGVDTSTMKNPTKVYDNNGRFPVMMVVRNDYGCIDTVFHIVEIEEDVNVFIPNTFTPNDDNINDVFFVKGIGLKSEGFYMEIYDRWGALLFATKDINKGWDGTVKGVKVQEGVYIYRVKVICENGVGKKEFKGHVTLMK
jgi:gliding motility-associated-like protein